jgi:hypothetical protein
VGETAADSARVALSFVRAHGGWMRRRYGLRLDPRRRIGRDYRFCVEPLELRVVGYSAGAAYAGRSRAC